MRIRFLLIIFFLFLKLFSYSQEYNYQHYDLTNGLSGLTVYSIAQDKNSYLWFATETGVSRFDGINFKNFTTSDGLPDNEVLKLFVDSKNRVWMLPFTNSICYYENGKIHSPKNDSILSKLKFINEPTDIQEDKAGNIVVIERAVIHIIKKGGNIFEDSGKSRGGFNNISVGINANGNIILCTGFHQNSWGVLEIDKITSSFLDYNLISQESGFINARSFIQNSKIRVYRMFNKITIETQQSKDSFDAPIGFSGFSLIDDSSFTFNCNDRIILYNGFRNRVVDTFLLGKTTNCCFRDNEDNFWFATTGYGIYRLTSNVFKSFSFVHNKNVLPVYSVVRRNDHLFVGSNNGLLWNIDLSNNNPTSNLQLDLPKVEGRITSLFTKDSKIFIGSNGLQILKENLPETTFYKGFTIKNIFCQKDTLLVATNIYLFRLSINREFKTDTIWKSRSTCVTVFNNKIYIGTIHGMYRMDSTDSFKDFGKDDALFSTRISAMTSVQDTLWIATYGNGVIAFSNNKIIAHITEKNGLTSNMCRNLIAKDDFLWVGTDKGLNKISLNSLTGNISTYTVRNGLSCDIINCVYTDHDTIFVGTPYGLTFFNPSEVDNNSIAVLNIDNIASRKNKWNTNDTTIQLSPDDNRLLAEFSCVSFKSQGNIMYHYRLIGADDQWHTTKENKLDFPSLSSGDYKLELYAVNAFGKESNRITIAVTVEKYFYQQTWFILLVSLFLLSILWFFISKRIAKIRSNENEKMLTQKRLSELEQLAFRAQMNPHFIFNCLNSIQQYIFSKNVIDANKFITEFASLIRQTMDLSARKLITLDEEIKFLTTYLKLEHTRFEENFDYDILLDKELDAENIYIPSLLLQPFLENSIRHGIRNLKHKKGTILVTISLQNHFVVCRIEDNGIGIAAAKALKTSLDEEHESKGISLIRKRIEVLNTENMEHISLKIENSFQGELDSGTTVILQIPDNL